MLSRACVLLAVFAGGGLAQQPPRPDSTRPPRDSTRPQQLPAIETRAPRDERTTFETKPNVGTISITGKELTSAPRFFGESDVLRAIRLLPGVNARNDFSVGMNVRGGEADQNLVLLDGYPIYNPFHMGGLFGAFVEPMVDRVEFLTGGFPANYGGRLSSVLDIHSAVEPRSGIHGRVDMSFIATTVAIGSGMQQGRGTWTVAARRTYADKFVDLIDKGALPYHFSDAQAHLTRVLPGSVRLSVTGYSNVDHMLQSSLDADNAFTLNWGNRLLGASLSRTWTSAPRLLGLSLGDSATFVQRFSASRFRLGMDLFESAFKLSNNVHDSRAAGQLDWYSARHARSIGYEVGSQRYNFNANYSLLLYPSDSLASRNTSAGVFYSEIWRPNSDWIVQAGARLDAVSGAGVPAIQPRISAKYFVTRNLAITGAFGMFAQWSHSLAREDVPIRALDFWVGSDARAPVSRALHYIAGLERWLSSSRALRVELFVKQYPSLIEQNPRSDLGIAGDEFLEMRGYSYGGDLMLRQLLARRFSGWLAYSYAFSSRQSEDGVRFFPGQDRRHELNAVGNWTRGRYLTSVRFNLATGTPYTRVIGQFDRREYDPASRGYRSSELTQFISGPRNAERLQLAQRLDLSLTRNGDGRGVSFSPFLSIMNVYNAKNYFAYLYDYTQTPPERVRLQQLPVFPTLGLSVVW